MEIETAVRVRSLAEFLQKSAVHLDGAGSEVFEHQLGGRVQPYEAAAAPGVHGLDPAQRESLAAPQLRQDDDFNVREETILDIDAHP